MYYMTIEAFSDQRVVAENERLNRTKREIDGRWQLETSVIGGAERMN